MKKYLVLALVVLLVLPLAFSLSMGKDSNEGIKSNGCTECGNGALDFSYVGRDLTTQGDWLGSRYGDCGYALPYGTPPLKEVAVGETTGIGESAHEYWWREPWSVPGEKYYAYEDYLGGLYILEYNITGSEGPPRALVDNDTDYYRPSWYGHESSITVTLTGIAGNYELAIYLLDWDAPTGGDRRRLRVNVTSSGDWDSADLGDPFIENFAAGKYAVFEVDSDGTIMIEVTNLFVAERYAVIAGIFLDSVSGPLTGVSFVGTDCDTKGNWRSTYGNDYYLLPGFNVPTSDVKYTPIDKSYDVTNIPSGSYAVSSGVFQYAADDARTYGAYPHIGLYSAYEWVDNSTATALDTRMLMYPVDKIYYGYPPTPLDRRYFGVWDSGELNGLLNHFMMRLSIPAGRYLLSIYAADFEQVGRSETIEIWNEPMTTMLDSQHITAAQINNGIYLQWLVEGPRIINIKAIADQGNLNSFINGIFMNCMGYCGKTPGFWKNNIRKALEGRQNGIQVTKGSIINALDAITTSYGTGTIWNYDWLTFQGSDNDKLTQAWNILEYGGNDMELKARRQILALLLTATHYGGQLEMLFIGWYDGGLAKTLVGWITTILNEYNAANYEVAKDLADYLNNAGCI